MRAINLIFAGILIAIWDSNNHHDPLALAGALANALAVVFPKFTPGAS